ncbi:MAG: RNA polymerase sigma factor [Candidatus Rokuibacteriota bacterium]
MEALGAGDHRAFEMLYERHRAVVFSFLVRLAGDTLTGEDLLQEAFLRVYRSRARYRPSGQFRAWLFTIARNVALEHLRRRGAAWEDPSGGAEEAAASERTEHQAEARELLARLERAVDALAPGQREIVLLSRVAGMDATDIAAVVNSSPGAVRVALHRALRKLSRSIFEGAGK